LTTITHFGQNAAVFWEVIHLSEVEPKWRNSPKPEPLKTVKFIGVVKKRSEAPRSLSPAQGVRRGDGLGEAVAAADAVAAEGGTTPLPERPGPAGPPKPFNPDIGFIR
jgi:hypothetical protein